METFRSRALDGFVLLKEVVFASVFLMSLIVALRWIRPAVFAVMTAVTGTLVVVAAVWDYTTPCSDEGCPELRGPGHRRSSRIGRARVGDDAVDRGRRLSAP